MRNQGSGIMDQESGIREQEEGHHFKKGSNHLYPVFLKLHELNLLVVGGGVVALEKLSSMLTNSPEANITLVAPVILPQIREIIDKHDTCAIIEREFEEQDLDERDLVIVATDDKEVSTIVQEKTKAKKILVNVADTPELCDFYLGSIVRKGQLKLAISTNGQSPTAAKRLKEVLQHAIPDEYDDLIGNLNTIRTKLNGDFAFKVKKLNTLTQSLVDKNGVEKENRWKKLATTSLKIFAAMLVGHFIFSNLPIREMAVSTKDFYATLDPNFHWMVLAGFLAQIVDGALGMGYGVTSTSILLSSGVNLAAISGSVHTAEMFAAGASGYSHYKFGNVNKRMFKALVIPGVLGAIVGAILLSLYSDTHASWLRPILAGYTMFLGVRILFNAFRQQQKSKKFKHYGWLAGAGGFLDSFGGGGWGPLVTSTLITKGRSPRYVIGSVSLTEFFVTMASAFTFFTLLGTSHWQVIVALVIGGLVAAPIAAKLAGKLPRKTSMILVGVLVIFWSLRIIVKVL